MTTRWQKIMRDTGCDEQTAKVASRILRPLADIKGAAVTMPHEVKAYLGDKLAEAAADIFDVVND